MCEEIFTKYNFHPEFGFAEPDPVETLPPPFTAWIELVKNIEELRRSPDVLRSEIQRLPVLDTETLDTRLLHLSHTLLSVLSHSYVHLEPDQPCSVLPASLSVPWTQVSARLGVPPVVIHATMSLSNWCRRDRDNSDMSLDNMKTIFSFDSTRDLEVFFMIPLLIEIKAVPAIQSIITVQCSVIKREDVDMLHHLTMINTSLENMTSQLKEMHANCSPSIFYHQHRPLLSGWRDNPSLPRGLMYQGVSETPLQYSGGSAAQSCALQIIDAGLGN